MNTVTHAHNLPYQEALDLILDFVGRANNGETREAIVTRLVTALVTPPQADTHIPATVRVPASMGKSEAFLSNPVYLAAAPVPFTYTNYRGETSVRRITPLGLRFGSTEWHPEPQWLMTAYDHDKDANRDFALKDFGKPALVTIDVREEVEGYEWRHDNGGGYTPNDQEKAMLEDFAHGLIGRLTGGDA